MDKIYRNLDLLERFLERVSDQQVARSYIEYIHILGRLYKVVVRKKTVDSTYMDVQVPSITKPKYEVAEGINLVPVNGLMNVRSPWEKYVVIGKRYLKFKNAHLHTFK